MIPQMWFQTLCEKDIFIKAAGYLTFIVQNDIKLQTSLVKLHNHELLQASISSLCSDKSFIMAHNIQYIQQHRSIWNRPISSAVVIVNIGTRAADNDCILSQIFCYFLCYIMINQ